MAKSNKRDEYESGGVAFIGCVLIGTGLGLLFDELLVGVLVGAGAGFVLMAILRR